MELKCFILYFTFNSSRLLLIAPLMELKYVCSGFKMPTNASFNRTAYGIEITLGSDMFSAAQNF